MRRMSTQTNVIPDDTSTLMAMVRSLRHENEHLKLLVAKLQRMQFGRRSEVLDAEDPQCPLSVDEPLRQAATLRNSLPRTRLAANRHASPCRHTCPGKCDSTLLMRTIAPIAVGRCALLARMCPKCWNMFRPASR